MPYYVYRIKPFAQLERLHEFGRFAEASAQAKLLRSSESADAPATIKVIFASDAPQAEELLCQARTAAPKGDD